MTEKVKKIKLHHDPRNDQNFVDDEGCVWTKFEVDYLALQEPGFCEECDTEILDAGFLCLDGGGEACRDCVEIVAPLDYWLTGKV